MEFKLKNIEQNCLFTINLDATSSKFIDEMHDYLDSHNNKIISLKLNRLTPVYYRNQSIRILNIFYLLSS